MFIFNLLIIISLVFCNCEGYRILAIFPIPARSHYILNSKLVRELANRGNNVTVITPFLEKSRSKNIKEISVESLNDFMNEQKKLLFNLDKQTIFEHTKFLQQMGYCLTKKTLEHKNVQDLLQNKEKFDVVIMPQFVNEALLGIAHHFKVPVVLVATMPVFSWSSFLLGHPTSPSYVPNLLSPYTGHMNFWQRIVNSFYDVSSILYHQWIILPKHRELVKKYIPGAPDLYDFLNNSSVLLINSHVCTNEAMPQVPNAIEIGGFHIEEPKALPQDLQKFLDESQNGVVVFSLGSNLKSSALPASTRDEILSAFSKLKQNVLWKWETKHLPGQPKNVKLMEWLPLNDVLAHPNVKAFITHGGLLSTMESVYHGVPALGIPVFGDQKMNMALAVSNGYAVVVPFQELNEKKLSWALDQILNNPKYRNSAKRRSDIMRDRPLKPIDSAIYWIEYVIRHQGAPHLRYPGSDLSWCQRNLLDVIAFVLLSSLVTISAVRLVFNRILKRQCKIDYQKKKIN